MPELHPGPDVSLGQLEAQLRDLGLRFNQGYYMTTVNGEWVLAVSEEDYKRWEKANGGNKTKPAETDGSAEVSTEDEPGSGDAKDSGQAKRAASKTRGR
jgi:hypothetical protein